MTETVNHPDHYNHGDMEAIDLIKAAMTAERFKGFLEGNNLKYLIRYRYKNGVEDLKKADWYLKRLIDEEDTDERLDEVKLEDASMPSIIDFEEAELNNERR